MLARDRLNYLRAALAASTLLAASAAPAYPLLNGLGGLAGYGENRLFQNDDSSSSEIDLRGSFPMGLLFFGRSFTSVYVNNNGNVSMGGAISTFTPAPFPIADQRMIAPWWADVDTRGPQTPDQNSVYWDISPGRFVVTWRNVGYYGSHIDRLNDFQLILTERRDVGIGDFDVEFRYDRCEWTTGDASGGSGGLGGTPAQVGFDAGDRINFFVLPGSRTAAILNVCTTSNVGSPGLWRFQIRNGRVAVCGNGIVEPGEECDDGNTRSGDGCSRVCLLEREFPPDAAMDAGPDVVDVTVPPDVPPDIVRDRGPEAGFPDVDFGDATVFLPDIPINDDVVKYAADVFASDEGPVLDAGTPDARVSGDGCVGWRCGHENRLDGRAGPFGGCACSAPGAAGGSSGRLAGLLGAAAAAIAGGVRRRVRRRRGPG